MYRAVVVVFVLVGLCGPGLRPVHAQSTVLTPIGGSHDEAFAVALQPDGKIVVAGRVEIAPAQNEFAVVRYNNDGTTLDTSFDGDGIATTAFGVSASANALAIQPDGKIVVAGFGDLGLGGGNDVVVVRYNTDGSLDISFDGDGIATTPIGAGASDDQGRAVAIYGDGQIVVGGYAENATDFDFAVVRYNADGSLDTAGFGAPNGYVTFGFPTLDDDWGEAIGVQGDQIVVAGDVVSGGLRDYGVVRFNADGSPDTVGFGAGTGYVTTDFFTDVDNARFLRIQRDNKIVVAGSSDDGTGDFDFSLARYDFDGTLDATFNPGGALPPFVAGKIATEVGGSLDFSYGLDLQVGGEIVLAGWSLNVAQWDFAVVRYNPDGTLDTTFNPAGAFPPAIPGMVTTDFGSSANEFGYGIAFEPDGRLVVAGSADNGTDLDVALARYCPDGNLLGPYQATSTYGYRKAITINSAQVSGTGDLADFPVLVDITEAALELAPAGQVEHLEGADIVFRAACGGAALDHEIELYDSGTGRLVVWVKVPVLQYDVDTVIYMYYGNASVTCSTQNAGGVWSSGYRGVWHLNEAALGPFGDSTALANDGVVASNPTTPILGQINGALNFDAFIDRHIAVLDDPDLRLATALTVSAWVTETTPDAQNRVILAKWGNLPPPRNYWLGNIGGATLSFVVDSTVIVSTPLADIQGPGWHHVVGVADAANNLLRIYVDGTERNTAAYGGTTQTGSSPLHFADNPGSVFQYWSGGIDESRVAFGARSRGWIQTEFNNQGSPGTFLGVGPEVTCPCTTAFNFRSVGVAPSPIYDVGTATVALNDTVVNFGGLASLPLNVGLGDRLVIGAETFFIQTRVSATQVIVQSPATVGHPGEAYAISRAYGDLQAWETAREGNLPADDRREIAVAYDDGAPFTTLLTIDGSTTDICHFMTVTVDVNSLHDGTAGSGVVIDPTVNGPCLLIQDDHARIEGLELTGWQGGGSEGVRIEADQTSYSHMIVHDNDLGNQNADGIFIYDQGDWTATIQNTIIYNVERTGIYLLQNNTSWDVTFNLQNVTVYNCGFNSILPEEAGGISNCAHDPGSATINAENVISVDNTGGDFNIVRNFDCDIDALWGTSEFNLSSDGSAPGGSPQAGTGASEFLDIMPAPIDLHLRAGAAAIDNGKDLSTSFCCDIDYAARPFGPSWDMGADE
ncbi:MAG: DUF2341 domain-containing protein, partial [Planctomycetota bacterium]